MKKILNLAILASVGPWLLACSSLSQAGVGDDRANLCLAGSNDVIVDAELAVDFSRRASGLMHRESLGSHEGMLFYYPSSEYRGFWMYQTLIPLDIAFLDDDGRIQQIKTMEPCLSNRTSDCPGYSSNAPARAALEVNAGMFKEQGIRVGDYVYDETCSQAIWQRW